MRKVYCRNTSCKHHTIDDGCDTTVRIGSGGKCNSFEKGFAYYFHIVWEALDSKNYIDMIEINSNPDLRIGLFYIMDCYDLGFSEMEWGTCRLVMLKDGEKGKPLGYEEIVARKLNDKKFMEHYENFKKGIMPGQDQSKESKPNKAKEFGWLSPSGEFTESPFGEHEESARLICEQKGFVDEYWKWVKATGDNGIGHLMRDFLSGVKGYCLIHNPTGYNGYIVTNTRNLTKKQKEFLYGYFINIGDRFKAEQYIEED